MTAQAPGHVPTHHVTGLISGIEQIARSTHYILDGVSDEAADLRILLGREQEDRRVAIAHADKLCNERDRLNQLVDQLKETLEKGVNSEDADGLHNTVTEALALIDNHNNPFF